MKISPAAVEHIAALAYLELTPSEREAMQRDLSAILEYVEQLNQLDTAAVEPMAQVLAVADPERASELTLRPDLARTCFTAAEATANAPAAANGFFKVPKIIER